MMLWLVILLMPPRSPMMTHPLYLMRVTRHYVHHNDNNVHWRCVANSIGLEYRPISFRWRSMNPTTLYKQKYNRLPSPSLMLLWKGLLLSLLLLLLLSVHYRLLLTMSAFANVNEWCIGYYGSEYYSIALPSLSLSSSS